MLAITSAGTSPCLFSMSLVVMARATSTTTMPTSGGGVKVKLRGATPNRHLAKSGNILLRGHQRLLRCGIAR